ncbi:MAG: polyketide synthase, partial [Deltaproteobacteria bacterium]|nr:polyketide synthase [Deltaproteobacteria bacterium]
MFTCFSKTPALSPTGEVKSFDRQGDGTLLGEGVGLVILKRLVEAQRDGNRVYAIIDAVGGSSDGKGVAIFAPKMEGQYKAIEAAYQEAGWTPDEVDLVEAHGTGTAVGDEVELSALSAYFSQNSKSQSHPASPKAPWCALGSVKSQIGHAKGAAGVAGLIKAILALRHKVLPPTIKVNSPLETLTKDGVPLYLNEQARPWLSAPGRIRKAAVSAFGFGGSNYHCLLSEYPEPKPLDLSLEHLVPISGQSLAELSEKLTKLLNLKASKKEAPHKNLGPKEQALGSEDEESLIEGTNQPFVYQKSLSGVMDSDLDALNRDFIAKFDENHNYRLIAKGTVAEIMSQAQTLLEKIGHGQFEETFLDFSAAYGPKASDNLHLSFSSGLILDNIKDQDLITALGKQILDLSLVFPEAFELLNAADALRQEYQLSNHSLGLIYSPPVHSPKDFQDELKKAAQSPVFQTFTFTLYQTILTALLKRFQVPLSQVTGQGLGLLTARFHEGLFSIEEVLRLALDLALDEQISRDFEAAQKAKSLDKSPASAEPPEASPAALASEAWPKPDSETGPKPDSETGPKKEAASKSPDPPDTPGEEIFNEIFFKQAMANKGQILDDHDDLLFFANGPEPASEPKSLDPVNLAQNEANSEANDDLIDENYAWMEELTYEEELMVREQELFEKIEKYLNSDRPGQDERQEFTEEAIRALVKSLRPGKIKENQEPRPSPKPAELWLSQKVGLSFSDWASPGALAKVLSEISARGYRIDFSQWPIWPKSPKTNGDFYVPISGANLFREAPLLAQGPLEPKLTGPLTPELGQDSQSISAALIELRNEQRKLMAMIEQLGQARPKPEPAPGAEFSQAPIEPEEKISPSPDQGHDRGPDRGLEQITDLASDLASAQAAARTLVQNALDPRKTISSGGNGKSSALGLLDPNYSQAVWERLAEVVSNETGYPVEALESGLELENDLGLDSIKKVELLAALSDI